jgi:Protein of unknown function (DUF1236)
MRSLTIGLAALSMLLAPAAFAGDLVIEPNAKTEFWTYVTKEKVKSYDLGFVRVGVPVPATYELQPVPHVIVKKWPKLKDYRYVKVGERIAIVEPTTRKVVTFIEG